MADNTILGDYIKPSKIFGNLYFVGTRAVCTHLIDTGEGLIIIDPGCSEGLKTVMENIVSLGFQIDDTKYILITHAHYDHMDSVRELVKLTGAKTFIGKDDISLLSGEIYHYPIKTFNPDVLLNDGDLISLGCTSIKCVSTPGHTDGTMSFFFDVTEDNQTYRAGLFGGAGCNTLRKIFMIEHNIPFSNRHKMVDSLTKLRGEKVEIFLGNHLQDNKTEEKLNLIFNGSSNPFIENGQNEWNSFLDSRMRWIEKIIEEDL